MKSYILEVLSPQTERDGQMPECAHSGRGRLTSRVSGCSFLLPAWLQLSSLPPFAAYFPNNTTTSCPASYPSPCFIFTLSAPHTHSSCFPPKFLYTYHFIANDSFCRPKNPLKHIHYASLPYLLSNQSPPPSSPLFLSFIILFHSLSPAFLF